MASLIIVATVKILVRSAFTGGEQVGLAQDAGLEITNDPKTGSGEQQTHRASVPTYRPAA